MKLKERWVTTSVPYCAAPNENHPQTHRVIFILYLVCLLDLRFSSIIEKRASVIFQSNTNRARAQAARELDKKIDEIIFYS